MINKKRGYFWKIFLLSFLIIFFGYFSYFFVSKSFVNVDGENITYHENSNLDYKVYLKSNDFYESTYLGKDMVYVANLIDKIDIDFNYLFKIDKKCYVGFDYNIVGKLIISDKSQGKMFFEKEYILLGDVKDRVLVNNNYDINRTISIDYDQYNDLANQFRSKYGVDVVSNLIVYFNVREDSDDVDLNNNSQMSLTIPLSLKAVNITMDYNEINKTSKLVNDDGVVIGNYWFFVLGIGSGLLGVFLIIIFIRLIVNIRRGKSKYDRFVKRVLREYDRLIVETKTCPDLDDKNVIEILKFQELLDVRDNLKLPIKYYVVKEHRESCFYINHGEEVYLFRLKSNM